MKQELAYHTRRAGVGGAGGRTGLCRHADRTRRRRRSRSSWLSAREWRSNHESRPERRYSAEAITETVQVLSDGNRIVRKTSSRIYRDSEGRTRREQLTAAGEVQTVSISDPVAGSTSFSIQRTRPLIATA